MVISMKFKKTLAMCLAAAMTAALAITPAFAAESISSLRYEINEDFEDYGGTGAPSGWQAFGVWDGAANGTFTPVPESTAAGRDGKGVKIVLNSGQYTAGIQKSVGGAVASDEYLDIEFDVKAVGEDSYPVIRLTDDANSELGRIRLKNGSVCQGDQADAPSAGEYVPVVDDWMHVKLRINGYNSTYGVWVDDNQVVNNGIYTYDGLKDVASGVFADGHLKRQNFLSRATTVLLGVYQAGECHYDNVTVVRSKRENFRNASCFETDFSDLTQGYKQIPDNMVVPYYYWGVGGGQVDEEHGMSLALMEDYIAGVGYKFDERVTEGVVTFEFDAYKALAAGNTIDPGLTLCVISNASTIDGWRNGDGEVWLAKDSGGKVSYQTGTTENSVSTLSNSWHTYKVVVDLSQKTQTVYYDGVSIGTQACSLPNLDGIRLWAYPGARPSQKGNVVYFDNFRVTTSPAVKQNWSHEDNFNTYTTVEEAVGSGKTFINESWSVNTPTLVKEGDNGYLAVENSNNGTTGLTETIEQVSSGVVRFSGSFMVQPDGEMTDTPAATMVIAANDAPNWSSRYLFSLQSGKMTFGEFQGGTDKANLNEWYDVVADIDLDAQKATVKVTGDGVNLTRTITNLAMPNIRWVRFHQGGATVAGKACFDNFKIEILGNALKEEPEVLFYNTQGDEVALSENMEADIAKISVDFGAAMDTASFMDAVSLKDAAGNSVEYSAEADEGMLTLHLSKLLQGNQAYTLTVSDTAMTAAGENIPQTYEVNFGTAGGVIKAENFSLMLGDDKVTDIAAVQNGVQARVSCDYLNTLGSEDELYLIFSWYKDNALTNVSYQKADLDPAVKFTSVSWLERIPSGSQADMLKVFLWRGEGKMIPVAENIQVPK